MTPTHQERAQADRIEWGGAVGPWSVGMASGHNACNVYALGDDAIAHVFGIASHRSIGELGARDAEGLANARAIAEVPAMVRFCRIMASMGYKEASAILSRIDGSEGGV